MRFIKYIELHSIRILYHCYLYIMTKSINKKTDMFMVACCINMYIHLEALFNLIYISVVIMKICVIWITIYIRTRKHFSNSIVVTGNDLHFFLNLNPLKSGIWSIKALYSAWNKLNIPEHTLLHMLIYFGVSNRNSITS